VKPNADITYYHFANGIYTREVIRGVFWFELKQSNVLKTGLTTVDSTAIHIPITSKESLTATLGKDIIINGIVDTDIDNTSQATQSASLKALKEVYGFVTVSACDPKLYGSRNMQHYEISCK
jgi:hypothetical protein